ncbi:MAG: radical SAM protein, partial [Acidobacteria bacterium]|nr:radical SAM protein [Acidobacteriota bacterium]
MQVVLISTYELGRQPFGLASPAAWLERAGATVACLDLSREPLRGEAIHAAGLIAFYVPMHTATRLAARLVPRIRALNPTAHLCFYGLYASVNEAFLRGLGAGTILGGEFEAGLVSVFKRLESGRNGAQSAPVVSLERLKFITPDRSGLVPLGEYARLIVSDGQRRTVGYTEASRG